MIIVLLWQASTQVNCATKGALWFIVFSTGKELEKRLKISKYNSSGRITAAAAFILLLFRSLPDHTRIDPVNVAIDKIPGIFLDVRKYVFLSLESLDFFVFGKEDGLQTDTDTGHARNESTISSMKKWE